MIPILIGAAAIVLLAKNSKKEETEETPEGLNGSWHAKGSKYRHTTDEKQRLKPGYKYVEGGDIVNIKTGKVYKGKKENVLVKPKKKKATKAKPKPQPKPKPNGITILKTSPKGAMLITDHKTTAWIMPRQRRADGSFTPGALKALKSGQPYLTKEEFKKSLILDKYVKIVEPFKETKTGKAIYTSVYIYEYMSEQQVTRRFFIPKSLVVRQEHNYVIIPKWFFDKKKEELFEDLETPTFKASTFELGINAGKPTKEDLIGFVEGLAAPLNSEWQSELKGLRQLKTKFKAR